MPGTSEDVLRTVSPIDGSVYVERPLATPAGIERALERATRAQRAWRETPLEERARVCERMVEVLVGRADEIGLELAWQMGRPVRFGSKEITGGLAERARTMVALAPGALADVRASDEPGFTRFIRREPLGTVLVLAPWNYPYLTAVNSVVPALLAGNAVILKHAEQTPLCSERYAAALAEAGLPDGVFQALHMSHEAAARVIRDERIGFVAFTGSVEGGRAVQRAAGERFVATGLELGGKDPAYVRPDADLEDAVASLVDGAFFNSGQSCCAVERIYVHRDVFEPFVDAFAALAHGYALGDPRDPATTLGPMVRASAAERVRGQVAEAVAMGARALIDEAAFPASSPGTPYLAPQVLVDVHHGMRVMSEESFGPVVGIMPVGGDDEAVRLMNDSRYGLTASVWTADADAALAIGARVETGTLFMNRCDYLDPELAWTGVKDSGRGCTLSRLGFEGVTRPKSFHLRVGKG